MKARREQQLRGAKQGARVGNTRWGVTKIIIGEEGDKTVVGGIKGLGGRDKRREGGGA